MQYQIHSVIDLPQGTLTSKYAYIGARDFQRWFDDAEPGELMVLKLTGSGLIRYVAVGGSHCQAKPDTEWPHTGAFHDAPGSASIYLPASIYDEFQIAGCRNVNASVIYELERATKIVLKPLDSLFYASGDMREVVENALMDYPLLQAHTQFSIELEQLGGYMVDMWVEACEPAEVVQLGGEVELEFVEGIEQEEDTATATATEVPSVPASSEIPTNTLPPPPPFANAQQVMPKTPTAAEIAAIREARLRSFAKKN